MPPRDTDGKLDAILERVNGIWLTLHGQPGEESKGLVVRMDRLEQSEGRRKWFVRAALGAAVTSLVAIVGKVLFPKWQ